MKLSQISYLYKLMGYSKIQNWDITKVAYINLTSSIYLRRNLLTLTLCDTHTWQTFLSSGVYNIIYNQ